jgi:hypothetical protein
MRDFSWWVATGGFHDREITVEDFGHSIAVVP